MNNKNDIAGYLINIVASKIVVYSKTKQDIDLIKSTLKIKDMKDIADLNKRSLFSAFFFETENEVDEFKTFYEKTKSSLYAYKKVETLPCALNKQLYLIMTLMHYKTATELRKPIADLKVGDLFYLYDQKHFVKVKLTKYVLLKNELVYKHRYEYKLAD